MNTYEESDQEVLLDQELLSDVDIQRSIEESCLSRSESSPPLVVMSSLLWW